MNTTHRARRSFWIVVGLGFLLASIQPFQAAEIKGTRAAIEAMAKKYDDAFNRRDAATMASLYHDEAQIAAPDQELIKGRSAIEAFWKRDLASVGFTQTSTVLDVLDHGDLVVDIGAWVGKAPDGGVSVQGKYVLVWKRVGEHWKVLRETWNDDRMLASSPAAKKDLIRAQEEYERAWLRQDAATLGRLIAEDYVLVDPEGKLLSKSQVVGRARAGSVKLEVGKSEDVKVRIYGDTAITTSRWTEKGTDNGQPFAGVMQNIIIFHRVDAKWQIVSDQSTVLKSPNP